MATYTSRVSTEPGLAHDGLDVIDGYGSSVASALTGLSYRRLDYLARKGYVRPSLAEAHGSGTRRVYSFEDLVALRTLAELRGAGVSLDALRTVVTFLRSRGLGTPLAEARLVVEGDDVLWIETEEEAVSLLRRPSQQALRFVVDVGVVVRELRRRGTPPGGAEGLQAAAGG
jgi:DNA-binding transcriptional MerR regulator